MGTLADSLGILDGNVHKHVGERGMRWDMPRNAGEQGKRGRAAERGRTDQTSTLSRALPGRTSIAPHALPAHKSQINFGREISEARQLSFSWKRLAFPRRRARRQNPSSMVTKHATLVTLRRGRAVGGSLNAATAPHLAIGGALHLVAISRGRDVCVH